MLVSFAASQAFASGVTCTGLALGKDQKMESVKVEVPADLSSLSLQVADRAAQVLPMAGHKVSEGNELFVAKFDETKLFGNLDKYVLVIEGEKAKLMTARVGFNFNTRRDNAQLRQYDLTCASI